MNRPPRLAEWWLARWVWPDEREAVLGDFSEQFQARVDTHGWWQAAWWYWRQAARLGVGLRALESNGRWERGSMFAFDDIRHAVRRLRKQPVGTLVSILTLALAVASATVSWSVVHTVLVSPVPVSEPDRLFVASLEHRDGDRAWSDDTLMFDLYQALRGTGAFEGLAAGGVPSSILEGSGPTAVSRRAFFASHDYFDTLGVAAARGRTFTADDDRPGAPLVAVVTHAYWLSVLGGDTAVLGRELQLASLPARIVGVLPPRFRGLDLSRPVDLFVPLEAAGPLIPRFSLYGQPLSGTMLVTWIEVAVRVSEGVSPAAAATQAAAALRPLNASVDRVSLTPLTAAVIPEASRDGVRRFGRLLVATAGLLLLIGSLTVGMLLMMRTEARQEEFAMCLALGASRSRLARSIALESALLCVAAAALALPLMVWLLAAVATYDLPGGLTIGSLDLAVRPDVLIVVGLVSLGVCAFLTAVAVGVGFRSRPSEALRARSGATPRLSRRWVRILLVTGQVAVSIVLASAAALFIRSVDEALGLNAHVDSASLLRGTVTLPEEYDAVRQDQFWDDLRSRLDGHPFIASVGYSTEGRAMGTGGRLVIDGEARPTPAYTPFIGIDERYLTTVGLSVVGGRNFEATDDADAAPVVLVSETFGRFIANGEDPVGHRVTDVRGSRDGVFPDRQVVGVVPDVVTRVTALEPPAIYLPIDQDGPGGRRVVTVRARGDLEAARREVQAAIRALAPALRPVTIQSYDELMLEQMGPQRFGAVVMSGLGLVALLLTLLGAWVMAESMSTQRRRELGIRAALGATRGQLSGLVLGETTRLVGAGLVVGLVLAWASGGLVRSLLFQVDPLDPVALGVVVCLIAGLTAAVSLRPALRAGRVDLTRILRED